MLKKERKKERGTWLLALGLVACSQAESPEVEFRAAEILPTLRGPAAVEPVTPKGVEAENCTPPSEEAPPTVTARWLLLGDGPTLVEGVSDTALQFEIANPTDAAVLVTTHYEIDAGTIEESRVDGNEFSLEPGASTVLSVGLRDVVTDVSQMRTSGRITAWATVRDAETEAPTFAAVAPSLFWHYGTADVLSQSRLGGLLTVYDELTLEQTYRGGALVDEIAIDEREHPSRVLTGQPLVTLGRTTPAELAAAGLLSADLLED